VGVDFDATNVAQFQGGQPGDTTASSSNVWTVAIVLSRRFRIEELLDFYLGPRLALTRYSSDDELPAVIGGDHLKFHRLDKDVGGVAGAELTLRRRFSIGAEVGAVYRFRGSASVEPQPLPVGVVATVPTGGHRLFSYGDLVIRWYFGRSART
jgi:hypothetical protein